jgi:SAM-dependent methyltransferase
VDRLPDDPAARGDELQRWAQEQQRLTPGKRRARVRANVADRLGKVRRQVARIPREVSYLPGRIDRLLDRFVSILLDRGLDTSRVTRLPEHSHDQIYYLASAWHVLPRALRHVRPTDSDTFVEFGCGKGRVVHQAARRPFGRVIGVEFSPELAEIARANLAARAHQHRCHDVEIVVTDARDFPVPDDLTVAYFFRPFGAETFEIVLARIVESIDRHPRRVRLISVWPIEGTRSMILATERFRLVKEQSSSLINPRAGRVLIFESC